MTSVLVLVVELTNYNNSTTDITNNIITMTYFTIVLPNTLNHMLL